MVPAVMAAALLAGRPAILLSIILSISINLWLLRWDSLLDAVTNTILFAIIAWLIGEVCNRLVLALRAETALTKNLAVRKALLKAILKSVPVVTLDDRGMVQRVTLAAAEILGVSPEEALGRPFQDFVPEFDEVALLKAQEGDGSALPPACWTARRPNGTSLPLTIQADVLPDDISPERIVLALADQTLADTMRNRQHDLNEQLSRVWRLNSMGEMAATLAHELNQPLTAASVYLHAGQTDLAKAGLIGDSASRALDLAKAQLLRAGEIVRRMRERISTGARTFTEERAALMIADLDPIFALISRDTDVAIDIQMDEGDDRVLADRIQLQQAVANLVRNAVDAAAGRASGQVSVTGRSLAAEGYEITVEDNGAGIADDQVDRIFRPMITSKAGGMGLGLSVTRSIVESHGAALIVGRSRLGGAAFAFRLSRVPELETA